MKKFELLFGLFLLMIVTPLITSAQTGIFNCPYSTVTGGEGGCDNPGTGGCSITITNLNCDCHFTFQVYSKCNSTEDYIGGCCICPAGGTTSCPNYSTSIHVPCNCEIIVKITNASGSTVLASVSSTGVSYNTSATFTDDCGQRATITFASPSSVQITCGP